MPKITFIGAGGTVFAKNILGDSMCTPALQNAVAYTTSTKRAPEGSAAVMRALNRNINGGRAKIKTTWGTGQRRKALAGADFVVNAIQVAATIRARSPTLRSPRSMACARPLPTPSASAVFSASCAPCPLCSTLPAIWKRSAPTRGC